MLHDWNSFFCYLGFLLLNLLNGGRGGLKGFVVVVVFIFFLFFFCFIFSHMQGTPLLLVLVLSTLNKFEKLKSI